MDTSGFRRTEASRSAERPRRTIREWWRASTPLERIIRVWWWCVCGLFGTLAGIAGAVMIGTIVLLA